MSSEEDTTHLCPCEQRTRSRPSSPRPASPAPHSLRNQRLPAVGTALQSAVEDIMQRDLLDTNVVVDLANSPEAQKKMEDLLPIHFFSWKLKNVQAALIYTLLHMFVLLDQYGEMVAERSSYQEYVANLKSRVAQLEDQLQQEGGGGVNGKEEEDLRKELLHLRRENAELRSEKAKLQASQNELFQINDAWSKDYNSLTRKIEALTSDNWLSGGSEHWTNEGHHMHPSQTPTTHPPSLTSHATPSHHQHTTMCHECTTLRERVAELDRQVREFGRRNADLEKLLVEEERRSKEKDMIIKTLDSENQAVQLQIQEIGDLRAAVRVKEDFRKLELQMAQKEKQYQDATSQKIQLQQQINKLKRAFMSIFGVVNTTTGRRHTCALRQDCRAQFLSEPLPPPPTPPGLIARGDHFGSLVEKDRNQRMLFDEQVTGFERATPITVSLPSDTHSWPPAQVTKRPPPRPNTLATKTNGHFNRTRPLHRYVACPTCNVHFDIEGEIGFAKMFDHVSYCDPTR